jgi:hypothetical protein
MKDKILAFKEPTQHTHTHTHTHTHRGAYNLVDERNR